MAEPDRESFTDVVQKTLGAGKWRAVAVQIVTEKGSLITMSSGDDEDPGSFRKLISLMGDAQKDIAESRLGEEVERDDEYWE